MPLTSGRYAHSEMARTYRQKHGWTTIRRMSNRRELRLVARALDRTGPHASILDCPCGAGRLLPVLVGRTTLVVSADASRAMIGEAVAATAGQAPPGASAHLLADAWTLPFATAAFDTVVCHRLIHHVGDAAHRQRLLRELRRVARRWVVLSFNDASTFKAHLQDLFGRRRSRTLHTPEDLGREALAAGLEMTGPVLRVTSIFSTLAIATLKVRPETGAVH